MLFRFYNHTGSDLYVFNSNTTNADDLRHIAGQKYGTNHLKAHEFTSKSKYIIIRSITESNSDYIAAALPVDHNRKTPLLACINISNGTGLIKLPSDPLVNMIIELGTYFVNNDRWIDPLYEDRFYSYGLSGIYEIDDIYEYMNQSSKLPTSDIVILFIMILIVISILTVIITVIISSITINGVSAYSF